MRPSRVGDRDPFRRPPQPLKRVKGPGFRAEDVHDEVEVIQQDPARAIAAFDVRRLDAFRPSDSWMASEIA